MLDCCATAGNADMGGVYAVKPDCLDDVPKTRFRPVPGKTLSERRWLASFSQEGVLDIAKVLSRVQRGGVHPTIKGAVWEFLLGCFDPKSTFDDRNRLREQRRDEYAKLKLKCQTMVRTVGSGNIITAPVISDDGQPVVPSNRDNSFAFEEEADNAPQDEQEIKWKLTLHQIGLDVVRTDRALAYYETAENRARLWDVLAVYSWIDKDIGYCQGMSDICSPMTILVENEADAFWCFERLMRRLRGNFKSTATSIGVRSQLVVLASIIKSVDPKLHQHLESLDGGEYIFAFRMLMVLFRREFSFVDTLYLWELMWSMEYNPNLFMIYESPPAADGTKKSVANGIPLKEYGKFERKNIMNGVKDEHPPLSIFLVASVLESRNKKLSVEAKGLDDVVKILNDITGKLDAKKACKDALKIHEKYLRKAKVS